MSEPTSATPFLSNQDWISRQLLQLMSVMQQSHRELTSKLAS
jgi:hypothetical protein